MGIILCAPLEQGLKSGLENYCFVAQRQTIHPTITNSYVRQLKNLKLPVSISEIFFSFFKKFLKLFNVYFMNFADLFL